MYDFKGDISLLHALCTTIGGDYILLYLLILYFKELRMSLHSIFSSEYFLYIQQLSFVANNKASMKHMQNEI